MAGIAAKDALAILAAGEQVPAATGKKKKTDSNQVWWWCPPSKTQQTHMKANKQRL